MASSGEDNAEDSPIDGTGAVAGDEGESHHSQDEYPRGDHSRDEHSRDDSVEYLGTIRKHGCPPSLDWMVLSFSFPKYSNSFID